ncbi:MAG: type II secretion system protein [Verrucomicrobiota bacterium]
MKKALFSLEKISLKIKTQKKAFTLIETMAVLGIMSLLIGMVIPVFNFGCQKKLVNTAYKTASFLEQARASAMANNTYVFVGFTQVKNHEEGGSQIGIAAMKSNDGTKNFGPHNNNLTVLAKPQTLDGIYFEESIELPATSKASDENDGVDLGAVESEDNFEFSHEVYEKIIQFDPTGAASIQSHTPTSPQWIKIGLACIQNKFKKKKNGIALVLDGVTGSVKLSFND